MVMKKTQRLYLIRTIQKNIVSFLAVALMVATGVSIYLGNHSAAKAILNKANDYFVANQLHSLEVTGVYGIREADLQAMKNLDQVDLVEGGYSTVLWVDSGNKTGKLPVRVHSLSERLNQPVVLEGYLPVAENEIALEQKMAKEEGIRVGDTLKVEHSGELKRTVFVVSAVINQPSYSCAKALDSRGMTDIGIGSVNYYMAVSEEAFQPSYFRDTYTTAYVKSYELDQYDFFSEEYQQKEAELKQAISQLGEERSQLYSEEIRSSYQNEIRDAKEELREYTAALEEANELVSDSLEKDWSSPEYIDLSPYYDKIKEVLKKAEDYLQLLEEELQRAESLLEEYDRNEWIVSVRNEFGDIRSIEVIVEGLYGLGYSMALIFLLVSVIVCYSAISRMINEERVRIGMQKALGFSGKEVLIHYMTFGTICGVVGIMEGWLASLLTVQSLSLKIYEDVFLFGKIPLAFDWKQACFVSIFFIAVFLLSVYFACKKEIGIPAVALLKGELPSRQSPFFFENWGLYRKQRLYRRTMVKNVLSDPPRVMTTTIGVAGCIVLLVISFTMLISMEESVQIQFEKYFRYSHRLVVDTRMADYEEFEAILKEEKVDYIRVRDNLTLYRELGGNWNPAHLLVVGKEENLEDFLFLKDPRTGKKAEIPEDGMLVSIKCAENHHLKYGSELEVLTEGSRGTGIPFRGTIEHYLGYNLFVVSEKYYEKVMGKEAEKGVFLLKGNTEGLYEKIKNLNGFLSIRDNSEYEGMGDSLVMVVLICFVFAAIMAVLVMLNQNVMYINRKAKELSIMRINGFTIKETQAFVSRDNLILTAIGILLGWGVGISLGYVVTLVMEVAYTHYIRTPSIRACLFSALIGMLFSYIMNKVAVRRIKKLNLTDINAN